LLVDDVSQLLLPISVYLVVLLLLVCVRAFRHRETRLGRWRYGALALFLWSYCFSTPAVANLLVSTIEGPYAQIPEPSAGGSPLIVVLSSGFAFKEGTSYKAQLGAAGWERTFAGIRLWKRVGGQLLFVGAPTPDGKFSLAVHMASVARTAGVPEDAIQVETKSRNTYENLLFTRELIARHQGQAWLVTSAVHMRRAMAVARKLALPLRPYPCDHRGHPLLHWYAWLPNGSGPARFAEAFHELLGLQLYKLKGYAS